MTIGFPGISTVGSKWAGYDVTTIQPKAATPNVYIPGNLTVAGTVTFTGSIATSGQYVTLLGGTAGAPSLDAGFRVDRGAQPYAGIFWDEGETLWRACTSTDGTLGGTLVDSTMRVGAVVFNPGGNGAKIHQKWNASLGFLFQGEAGGNEAVSFDAGGVYVRSGGAYGFSSSATDSYSPDTRLYRDAAGVLALRNGTNNQRFRVYESETGSEYIEIYAETAYSRLNAAAGSDLVLDTAGVLYLQAGSKVSCFASLSSQSGNERLGYPTRFSAAYLGGNTVTASTPVIDLTQTWSNGAVAFTAIKANITNTASASTSLLMDLQVGGSGLFQVFGSGNVVFRGATEGARLRPSAYGEVTFEQTGGGGVALVINTDKPGINVCGNVWLRGVATSTLVVGNLNSATPAAQTVRIGESARSGTDTDIGGSNGIIQSGIGTGAGAASEIYFQTPTAGGSGTAAQTMVTRLTIAGNASTWATPVIWSADNTYDIGLVGSNRPRRVYVGTEVVSPTLRLAAAADNVWTTSQLTVTATLTFNWNGRSVLSSPANGNILLRDSALTAFGLLQFGGTTSSFPALKRSGASFQIRLADDSDYASVDAGAFYSQSYLFATTYLAFADTNGPKLKKNGTAILAVRNYADDAYATVEALQYQVGGTDLGVARDAANVARVTDGSTGIGFLLVKTPISPKTTDYGVAATDARRCFTNEGAGALVTFTLPTAAAGLTYTFVVQDADGVKVLAAAGDTVRLGSSVSAVAGYAQSTDIGSTVTLVAINATEWVATSVVGTWTVT